MAMHRLGLLVLVIALSGCAETSTDPEPSAGPQAPAQRPPTSTGGQSPEATDARSHSVNLDFAASVAIGAPPRTMAFATDVTRFMEHSVPYPSHHALVAEWSCQGSCPITFDIEDPDGTVQATMGGESPVSLAWDAQSTGLWRIRIYHVGQAVEIDGTVTGTATELL